MRRAAIFSIGEYLPAAMAPDQDYDDFGVFSGSAIVKDGKQYLLYTGVKIIGGEEHRPSAWLWETA